MGRPKGKVVKELSMEPICEYLKNKLGQNNFINEFLQKGGLRCEILSSGKITVGDVIK